MIGLVFQVLSTKKNMQVHSFAVFECLFVCLFNICIFFSVMLDFCILQRTCVVNVRTDERY